MTTPEKKPKNMNAPLSPGSACDRLLAISAERPELIREATRKVDERIEAKRAAIVERVPEAQRGVLSRMLQAAETTNEREALHRNADGSYEDADDEDPAPQISPRLMQSQPAVEGVEIDREKNTSRRVGAQR